MDIFLFRLSRHLFFATGSADSPGSQVFPVHASGWRDPQADPGEASTGERVGLLCEEWSLRLPADSTGGVFGQWHQLRFERVSAPTMTWLFQAHYDFIETYAYKMIPYWLYLLLEFGCIYEVVYIRTSPLTYSFSAFWIYMACLWFCLALQSTLAVWVKWPQHPSAPSLNSKLRQHGAVCHQDPR